MKSAMAQKPPETALWARRIFSARMSANPAGRKIAMAFRRFAKQARLPPAVMLAIYHLRLRFKRCDMPPKAFLIFHRTKQTATGINF